MQRIVGALVAEGLLMTASPGGRVRLGMEILALAASSRIDVVELAHPHLKALSEEAGETVDLSVLKKDHLVFVDQVVGPQRLRAVSAVGEIFPLHSTANGKACLALMSEADVRARLAGEKLVTASGKTRRLADLLAELAEVRRRGVAFDDEEHSLGISAVGTAFADGLGQIYAVSIPAPTSRFAKNRERLATLLLAMRRELVSALGGADDGTSLG